MAITKLISPSTPNPLPPAGAGGDWDKAMAQLTAVKKLLSGEQMILTQWTNNTTAPALARGSYLQHLGAIYVVDTEDYALPALSADGTYYIKLTISGETLVPTYITSLAGFSWIAQHNGLYNVSDEQVLPYSVIREGSSYGKRKILNLASSPNLLARVDYQGNLYGNAISGASLDVTGEISGNSLTGPKNVDHSNETNIANGFSGGPLHLNYRGASSPITELRIDNGMGDGGLIPVSCSSINFTSLNPDNSVETSIQLSAGDSYMLPKGAYAIKIETTSASAACQMYHDSSWITIFGGTGGFVISDGVNFRLNHGGGSGTFNIRIRKW